MAFKFYLLGHGKALRIFEQGGKNPLPSLPWKGRETKVDMKILRKLLQ